ncbi:hypothetical protein BANRA_05055 [Escherichia coli]|nr:hypothetical protein BANRA_05055 [Escherichia coli]
MNDGSLSENGNTDLIFMINMAFRILEQTPEYKAAFKALKVRQRLTYSNEFHCFLLFSIYLFVLGLWKKAIIVLLLGILSLFVGINWR